ncbi:YeeE/YedE thiosulfate transporter family protein [Fluviibacterium sp. DFM31]|uniref:YeeE/YedE thiosulfate transporter family protein n=1 Tax=Meridianimarinicoccus marinus TaxID=3231483 RepID=A0ABV3L4L5_9RHOB
MHATRLFAVFGVGLAVALGWVGTHAVAQLSFEPASVSSVTNTGPATDTLMALINERGLILSFSLGLVPGVFLGSALTALLTGEFQLQRFDSNTRMERYLVGAVLMGFGAMLASGCGRIGPRDLRPDRLAGGVLHVGGRAAHLGAAGPFRPQQPPTAAPGRMMPPRNRTPKAGNWPARRQTGLAVRRHIP